MWPQTFLQTAVIWHEKIEDLLIPAIFMEPAIGQQRLAWCLIQLA